LIKYKRCIGTEILAYMAFFIFLGVSIFVGNKWSLTEFLILFCILELPMIYLFPLGCQTIRFDENEISTGWWFIKFRTFSWSEVCETGIAYTQDKKTGSVISEKFIYISKRPVTNKERFFILGVKDYKKFITMENRGNIIEDIKKYSKLPFQDLPTTEDFYNM
jgi:hypothetical protein